MVNRYRRGRIAERKVADYLKSRGFKNVRRSRGSRGPADIYAVKDGVKYYIQVKTNKSRISKEEIRKLRELAKKRRGVAAYIHKKGSKYKWKFFGNWSK